MADTIFNPKTFVIDKVRRVTQVNLATDLIDWTMTSIESPQIEFTGESTEKTDADGTLIAKFDTAKGATFSGEGSLLSVPMLASQLGTTVEVANTTDKVKGEIFEILTLNSGTATMSYTPSTAPTYVYGISDDKNIGDSIKVGTATENAKVSNGVITMPASYKGTMVGVHYEFETDSAVKVTDGSENYADAAKYMVDLLVCDVCNPSVKRAGTLVFPKAKIDNNVTIDLTTEGTHPFSFEALKDYCGEGNTLCYWLFPEKTVNA